MRARLGELGPEIACAYLFGSEARGTASSTSDIDVGILLAQDPPRTLEGLRFDLADRLQAGLARQIDLILMNRATPELVHRILCDGVLIIENDPAARVAFEVRSRNAYFDRLPYLQEYRQTPPRRTS